jgi:hypothetical protein
MTISLDTKSTGSGSSNPVVVSHTCSADTDLLIVELVTWAANPRNDGVPSYNAVDMVDSGAGERTAYNKIFCESFRLIGPDTGSSYDVSVPNTYGRAIYVLIASYEFSAGSVVFESFGWYEDDTANPYAICNGVSNPNGLAVGVCCHDKNNMGSYAPGSGYTELYAVDLGADTYFNEYDLDYGAAGDITVDWTQAADDYGVIAQCFSESAAAAVSNPPRRKPLRMFRR